MSDRKLRKRLIRLAHRRPELRRELLPLLSKKAGVSKRDVEQYTHLLISDAPNRRWLEDEEADLRDEDNWMDKAEEAPFNRWSEANRWQAVDILRKYLGMSRLAHRRPEVT